MEGNPNSHPPVYSVASWWYVARPCAGSYPGPAPSLGWAPTSLPQTATPPAPPLCKNVPTISDPPPPGSVSAITAPNSFLTYQGCLRLQASHSLPPSTPVPGIETLLHYPAAPHMPQKPSLISTSAPPPLASASSATPPYRTELWQGACCLVPVGGPACHIGCIVGGGGFPPPEWPRCPGHSGVGSVPALPFSPPLGPGITPTVSSAVLPWTGRPLDMSVACHLWPGFPNYITPLAPAHAESSCDSPYIPPPYPPRTTWCEPVSSGAPCRWGPPPLSV